MIQITAAVETDVLDSLFLCSLGKLFTDCLGSFDIAAVFQLELYGRTGNQCVALLIIDDLSMNMSVGTEDTQTWAIGSTEYFVSNTF